MLTLYFIGNNDRREPIDIQYRHMHFASNSFEPLRLNPSMRAYEYRGLKVQSGLAASMDA